ncbi:MAG TPA: TonB-dependent receptor [Polyangiaceae bacterium]
MMVCLALGLLSSPAAAAEPVSGESAGKDGADEQTREDDLEQPEAVETPIEYPDGERSHAEVIVELTIDRTGAVTDARVVQGEPPFSDIVLRVAPGWRFTPARRAGRAVPARFRFRVEFEPPPEAPAELEPGTAPSAEPAAPKPPPEPAEVVVRGQRPPPGVVRLSRAEARAIPGTFGDPLRSVEAQPGVVPIMSGLPSFFVRGAPPGNVGFFIDGIDVPLLYHAFFGPSVIHPGLIDGVELYSGVAPVEFGRVAGPIVSAQVRPLERRFNGEASIRVIDAGALVEAPFGGCDGPEVEGCSRGSARVGGRYSYTGVVLSLLGNAELNYWDYQGQGSYRLGPDDELSLLAFGAYDFFRSGNRVDQGGGEVEFHRVDLRWDHRTPSSRLRVGVTGGYDSTGGVESVTSVVTDRSLRARVEYERDAGESVVLKAGLDGRVDDFGLETDPLLLNYQDYSALFPARTETVVGAYVSTDLHFTPGIVVVPGVRADVYNDRGTTAAGIDPRISAAFDLSRPLSIETSLGLLHQKPNFVPQVPAAQIADLEHGLTKALMWSSRVRYEFPDDLTASAGIFRNAFFDVIDPLGGERNFSIDRTAVNQRATISSMGLELQLTRPLTRKLGGFLAYTLSRTIQTHGRVQSISGFDRPHVLQGALGYDFGAGITAGTRAVFYSGVPELNFEGSPHFVEGRRGAPYFRMDARVEKRWRFGERTWLGVVAEVLNATSTTETVRLDCGTRCVERKAGPVILPSIGVEGGF